MSPFDSPLPAVRDSLDLGLFARPPRGPALAARALEPETDAAQSVAAEVGNVDAHLDRDDAATMEQRRQSRLRLWQAQR